MNALRTMATNVRQLAQDDPAQFEELMDTLDPDEAESLLTCWQLYARPNQVRPLDCKAIWFRRCGRGEGKTRSGAEELLDLCEDWGANYRGIVINKTLGDGRKISIRGDSGIMACAQRRGYKIRFQQQDGLLYHPAGGIMALYTPEKPDGPRGFRCNHFWADEVSSWMNAIDTWTNLMFAWQLKAPPGCKKIATVTSTPKANVITHKLLKTLSNRVTVTAGRTLDNAANLSDDVREDLEEYEGTRIGRQEAEGEYLDDDGTTFDQDNIHDNRTRRPPELVRRIVSLDPSIDDQKTSDDAGLAVVGSDDQHKPHAYVIETESVTSHRLWARRAVELFIEHDCDCIVAEINQGGKLIPDAIQVAAEAMSEKLGREIVVPVQTVWQSESKKARAEPIGALYERGRVHHVGVHKQAEKELTSWVPGMPSPNIMDALVQGVAHLLLTKREHSIRDYL